MANGEFLKCSHCGGELGLRERYERILDLLQAGLIVFDMNNKFEANPTSPEAGKNVMIASVQMHEILSKYWEDVPGTTLQEKLEAIESKRHFERGENGELVPRVKQEEAKIIL